MESNVKPFKKNDYEVLPEPNMSSGGVGTENEDKGSKAGGVTVGGTNSLLAGDYNEAESHNQFLEALNAWRNAGKPQEEKKPAEKVSKALSLYVGSLESEVQ